MNAPQTCLICFETMMNQRMVQLKCSHFFCDYCFEKYISETFQSRCPTCLQNLEPDLLRKHISQVIWEKLEAKSSLLFIRKLEHMVYCPNPSCNNGFIFETSSPSCLTCQCLECATIFCLLCKDSHEGETCQEFLNRNESIKLFETWRSNTDCQFCPKCHFLVSKIDGCDVMTCSQCLTNFCYLCGKEGTYAHDCEVLRERQRRIEQERLEREDKANPRLRLIREEFERRKISDRENYELTREERWKERRALWIKEGKDRIERNKRRMIVEKEYKQRLKIQRKYAKPIY